MHVATFRPRRAWGANAFLVVWLAGWCFGEAFGLVAFVTAIADFPEQIGLLLFMLVWLPIWTIGGAFALATVAYNVAGRESVNATADAVEIRRAVGRFGRTRRYRFEAISDLRVLEPADGGAEVAFTYERKGVRFGERLDRASAEEIVELLRPFVPRQTAAVPPRSALRDIAVYGSELEVRRGFRSKRYDRGEIRNVRAVPTLTDEGPDYDSYEVAFDHRGKDVRLGGTLTYGEAEALAKHLREQLVIPA